MKIQIKIKRKKTKKTYICKKTLQNNSKNKTHKSACTFRTYSNEGYSTHTGAVLDNV